MSFENFLSKTVTLICAIYLFSTTMATFTRYTKPVPEGAAICETYEQLVALTRQYPNTMVSDENGGYYMKDVASGKAHAVAADSLVSELDRRLADADAQLAERKEAPAPDNEEDLKAWVTGDPHSHSCTREDASDRADNRDRAAKPQVRQDVHPNRCSHPRCFFSAHCLTFTDCHVCLSSRHHCI